MTTLMPTKAIYFHGSIIAFAIILANLLLIVGAIVFITKKSPKKEESIMSFEKGVELLFTSNLKKEEQKREKQVILHIDENPERGSTLEVLGALGGELVKVNKNVAINMVLTRYPKRGEVASIPCAHDLENVIQGKSIKRGILYGPPGTGKTHAAGLLAAKTDALVIKIKAASLLGDGSDFSDMKKATLANLIKEINTKHNKGVVLP